MESDKRRIRGANYTWEEKQLLIQLVRRYEYIIEEKRLNSTIAKQKQEAWRTITRLFNQKIPNVNRTLESLRKFYKNIKTEKRRARQRNGVATVKSATENHSSCSDVVVKEEPLDELIADPAEFVTEPESSLGEQLDDHNHSHPLNNAAHVLSDICSTFADKPQEFSASNGQEMSPYHLQLIEHENKVTEKRLEILNMQKKFLEQEMSLRRQSLMLDIEIKKIQLEKLKRH